MAIVESYVLTPEEYETLARFAVDQGGLDVQTLVDKIDERHGVRKHRLWVRWRDSQAQRYPSVRFPEEWPPTLKGVVEVVGRPVARADVLAMVHARTPGAVGILVTIDPRNLLGWQDLDVRFPILWNSTPSLAPTVDCPALPSVCRCLSVGCAPGWLTARSSCWRGSSTIYEPSSWSTYASSLSRHDSRRRPMAATRKPQSFYEPPIHKKAAAFELSPVDILPPEARKDPKFDASKPIFATQQDPALAEQYGVVRQGVHLLPDGTSQPVLRPRPAEEAPQQETSKPEPPSILQKEEEVKEPDPEDDGIPEPIGDEHPSGVGDLAQIRESVLANTLAHSEQRKLVESRLIGKFTISDFIMGRPIRQTHVISDRLNVTFEATDYRTELGIRAIIAEEAQSPVFNEYLLDKLVLLGLSAALYAINGNPLPEYRKPNGRMDPKMLEAKLDGILRLPTPFVEMLTIHFSWFHERMMRELQAAEMKVGNG